MKTDENLVPPRPIQIPFDEALIYKLVNTILKKYADHIFPDHEKDGSHDNITYTAIFDAVDTCMRAMILKRCKNITPYMDLKDIERAVLSCIDTLVNIDGRRIIINKYGKSRSDIPNMVPFIECYIKLNRVDNNTVSWPKINHFLSTIRHELERTINWSYTDQDAFQAWIDDESDTGGKDTYATDNLSRGIESFTCRNENADRTFFHGNLRYKDFAQNAGSIPYTYKVRTCNHEIIALAIFSPEGKILYEQGEAGKVIQQPYDTYVATVKDELIQQLSKL